MDVPIIISYLQVVIVTLVTTSIIWVWRKWTYWDRLDIPNTGPFAQFLAYRGRRGAGDVEIEWYKKYGEVFGVYKIFKPVLVVASMEHSKNILIRDFTNFPNHTPFHSIDPRFNQNLFSLRNDHWKRMRGIVSPTFSSLKLRGMCESITNSVHTFIKNISNLEAGSSVSIKNSLDCLAIDVSLSCGFGPKSDCLNDSYSQVLYQSKQIFKVFFDSTEFFGSRFVDLSSIDYISKFTLDLVQQRRQENETGGKKRSDFLQALVDAKFKKGGGSGLSDDEICGFGISFFTDGFESTSNMSTAVFFYLATNQRVQSKLFEEVSSLSQVDADSVNGLNYLDAVVTETARLWTSSLRNDRVCEKDYKLEGTDIIIPAGMAVDIPVYAMHRDPKYFPDPLEFKPERYMAGGTNEDLSPVSILTFGAGPKQCIAIGLSLLQIKVTMCLIVRKFRIGSTPLTKLENQDGERVFQFPKEVFITLEQR